jgi:chorismate dehydratase
MSLPRISAISFLNTAPLMWDFEHTPIGGEYEISYTVPSRCAEALRRGEADAGLIPAVTYLTIPDLVIAPQVAIAARGAVRSILLVSRMPLERVRTVAADTSSRTSVVLCDLLFRRWFPAMSADIRATAAPEQSDRIRQIVALPPDLEAMLLECDAALLIGDSALRVDRTRYLVLDLAEEWRSLTGKPFVFAFWAMRRAAATPRMAEHFRASRDHGLEPANLDTIARLWAPRVGISEADVRSYLTENICFDLDPANLAGLALFLRMAAQEGLLPAPPSLDYLDAEKAAEQKA